LIRVFMIASNFRGSSELQFWTRKLSLRCSSRSGSKNV
jgi:hypothetical protein